MGRSYKIFFISLVCVTVLIAGFFAARFFLKQNANNPVLVTFDGGSIRLQDTEVGLNESERTGNSIQYKKQIALNMIRKQVIGELASKENLSQTEWIKKIRAQADASVSEADIEQFLKERQLNRKKLTPAQIENIKGNLAEQKREIFFRSYFDQILESKNIRWNEIP